MHRDECFSVLMSCVREGLSGSRCPCATGFAFSFSAVLPTFLRVRTNLLLSTLQLSKMTLLVNTSVKHFRSFGPFVSRSMASLDHSY